MKNVRKYLGIATLVALMITPAAMVITTNTGCVHPSGTNGVSQATIDATAVVLRGAARSGAIVAINPPNGNTNNAKYFSLAADTIGIFITGKDYTPESFQEALMKVGLPQNQWVQLGFGTVIDLYQLYYGQYVKDAVAGEPIALQFLAAVQDGFNQALGRPTTFAPSSDVSLPRPMMRKAR